MEGLGTSLIESTDTYSIYSYIIWLKSGVQFSFLVNGNMV